MSVPPQKIRSSKKNTSRTCAAMPNTASFYHNDAATTTAAPFYYHDDDMMMGSRGTTAAEYPNHHMMMSPRSSAISYPSYVSTTQAPFRRDYDDDDDNDARSFSGMSSTSGRYDNRDSLECTCRACTGERRVNHSNAKYSSPSRNRSKLSETESEFPQPVYASRSATTSSKRSSDSPRASSSSSMYKEYF